MINLSTTYLGLRLKNPLVVSASPLCEDIGNIRRMEDAGAAAVVLHSLFEEQITEQSLQLDHYLSLGTESYAESLSYFPDLTDYNLGPEGYLDHIHRAKAAVDIPIIASLNGVSTGGWVHYARKIEDAGADALELNIYSIPTDPSLSGVDVEQFYVDLVRAVRSQVTIPLAVKLSPYFSAPIHLVKRLEQAGANAFVLFNRFYQPDFDLESLDVTPNLDLSRSYELRLRLRWVAILFGHIRADMAVTGGVHTGQDVLKAMMAGARAAMMTSALLKHGVEHLVVVRSEVSEWMKDHEYDSIEQMQGSMSQASVARPAALERANYMKVLSSYDTASSRL